MCHDRRAAPAPCLLIGAGSGGSSGGFLYISEFKVKGEHSAAALRAVLLCPELAGKWSVATYICDGGDVKGAFLRAGFRQI